jgi:hypothetical protein
VKAWPIDPLVFRNFKLEVSEKLTAVAFESASNPSNRLTDCEFE